MRCQSVKVPTDYYRGTEKQNVADDYAKRLHIGQVECEALIADVAGMYISGKSGFSPPKFQTCHVNTWTSVFVQWQNKAMYVENTL